MDGFGAMLAFEVDGGAEAAQAVAERVRVIVHATSLGGVETLIERRSRYADEAAPRRSCASAWGSRTWRICGRISSGARDAGERLALRECGSCRRGARPRRASGSLLGSLPIGLGPMPPNVPLGRRGSSNRVPTRQLFTGPDSTARPRRPRSPASRAGWLPPSAARPAPAPPRSRAPATTAAAPHVVSPPAELVDRHRPRALLDLDLVEVQLARIERARHVVGVEARGVDRLLEVAAEARGGRAARRAATGPACRRRACRSPCRARRSRSTSVGVSVVRGRLPGSSEFGSPSVSQNICARVPRQKPRPGTIGEPCSQPPLGVAETRLPWRSATSRWQVSPARPSVGSPEPAAAAAVPRAAAAAAARVRPAHPAEAPPTPLAHQRAALVGVRGAQQRRQRHVDEVRVAVPGLAVGERELRALDHGVDVVRPGPIASRSKPASSASCWSITGPCPHGPVLQIVWPW